MTPLTRRFTLRSFKRGGSVCRRAHSIAGVLCLTLVMAACGDSGNGPERPPPGPQLVAEGPFTLSAPTSDVVYFVLTAITTATLGQWDATVNWTFDTNTLWMWVAEGTCTVEQFSKPECPFTPACECQFVVRSETATPKPRVLSIPNARAGTRTLIIANLGPREESGTYRVMLAPSSLVSSEDLSVGDLNVTQVSYGQKPAMRR